MRDFRRTLWDDHGTLSRLATPYEWRRRSLVGEQMELPMKKVLRWAHRVLEVAEVIVAIVKVVEFVLEFLNLVVNCDADQLPQQV